MNIIKKIIKAILYALLIPIRAALNFLNKPLIFWARKSIDWSSPANKRGLAYIFDYARRNAHEMDIIAVRKQFGIPDSVRWDVGTRVYGLGNIKIGEGTYIGGYSYVLAHPEGVNLTIGKYCTISHGVHIRTEVHKKKYDYKDEIASPPMGADVVIGDYVWIGANVYIGGGRKIGSNSIIGANSVVTCDIPPNTIYGGVPAKLIRNKSDYLKSNGKKPKGNKKKKKP